MAFDKINLEDSGEVTTSKGTYRVDGRAYAMVVRITENRIEINEPEDIQVRFDSKHANIRTRLEKSL